ncbi:MAG: transglycosylase SLT domain-containing protein [Hyphomonadaceae bacterium]|nr:transglycosylase SLT domain-containing protein [Hyphomonadaceae bacterium]
MITRKALRALFAIAAIVLTGCATTAGPGGGAIPRAGYPPNSWDVRLEGETWTATTHAAIDVLAPQLLTTLPADIDAFCPGYRTAAPANRRAFYVALLSELARYESNFDPAARVQETFTDASGQRVVSRGLLRLSPDAANGAGCAITNPQQLHDPTANIQCAVRILNRWVTQDQLIAGYSAGAWRGASRTWTSLRAREKLADLQAATNAKPYCARAR